MVILSPVKLTDKINSYTPLDPDCWPCIERREAWASGSCPSTDTDEEIETTGTQMESILFPSPRLNLRRQRVVYVLYIHVCLGRP